MHSPRQTLTRLRELLDSAPELAPAYDQAKEIVRRFRRTAFYEVSTRCNLRCEGCYYFTDSRLEVPEDDRIESWERFFASEAERGVTMAYFLGAEPALEPERLEAASRHLRFGNIGTNGTVRIDPAIPYRIALSIWAADEETDARLRGGATIRKILRNYAGDPRAIVLHTLNSRNLDEAELIAELCRDHGLPLTFNMFSPPQSYARKLERWQGNDQDYFRISTPEDNLRWGDDDLMRARDMVARLMERFEDTIVYSGDINEAMTRPGPMYMIDPETGEAPDCHSRIGGNNSYFTPDLRAASPKCCTPDIDCSECRMHSGAWSTRLLLTEDDLRDADSLRRWTEVIAALGRIFVYDADRDAREAAPPRLASVG